MLTNATNHHEHLYIDDSARILPKAENFFSSKAKLPGS
jgi:hypothetical protein